MLCERRTLERRTPSGAVSSQIGKCSNLLAAQSTPEPSPRFALVELAFRSQHLACEGVTKIEMLAAYVAFEARRRLAQFVTYRES
ncbi:hypothetical protein L596_027043 [Steinernema carpocapsae]|uniref:Uncharacterized protein n=1 Tax=Steinernema carpocapsae TaxID=34508 RepID=A0A4U5M356_STECR|nr:hypothetical protein L596_027043 [Steinernema carpocapsae]